VDGTKNTGTAFEDIKVDVKIKLSALWASAMFCYIYADYFGLYVPDSLQQIQAGKIGGAVPATQGVLLGASLLMAIPSVMIFLSVALRPRLNRLLNMIFGVVYTLVILVTMWQWAFYVFFGIIEMALTGLVVWYAWTWPRAEAASPMSAAAQIPTSPAPAR
jgi:hypothetical protein